MPGKFFDPARFQLVAGDHALFVNADLVTHDVRVPAGPFDSGPMGRGARWDQAFETAGSYPFLCTLHPFMSGTAEVVNATIAASPEGVVAGEQLTISGRAPAGTAAVGLVRTDADGTATTLPGAAPAADGTYAIATPARRGRALPRDHAARRLARDRAAGLARASRRISSSATAAASSSSRRTRCRRRPASWPRCSSTTAGTTAGAASRR